MSKSTFVSDQIVRACLRRYTSLGRQIVSQTRDLLKESEHSDAFLSRAKYLFDTITGIPGTTPTMHWGNYFKLYENPVVYDYNTRTPISKYYVYYSLWIPKSEFEPLTPQTKNDPKRQPLLFVCGRLDRKELINVGTDTLRKVVTYLFEDYRYR